jgi:hypothetical protein
MGSAGASPPGRRPHAGARVPPTDRLHYRPRRAAVAVAVADTGTETETDPDTVTESDSDSDSDSDSAPVLTALARSLTEDEVRGIFARTQ